LTGYEYDFTVLSSCLGSQANPKALSVIFFLLLTLTGLNTLSLTLCMTLNFLVSQFAFLKGHRHSATCILLVFYFLFGILFCTEQGLRFIWIWEYYAIGLGPLCLVAVEIYAIFYWSREEVELIDKDHERLARTAWFYVKYVLLAIVGGAILVTFISDCMNPLKIKGYEQGLVWLLFLVPLLLFVLTVKIKKKQLLFCVKDQVVEGHVLDLEGDRIDSDVSSKINVPVVPELSRDISQIS